MIAELWAKEIIANHKTFKDVPSKLKEQVRQLLINKGKEDLIIE